MLSAWCDTFKDVPTVEVLEAPPSYLHRVEGINAELMSASIAHRRFGGSLVEGIAQILINNDDPNAPRWIIAAPSIPTGGGWVLGDDGKLAWAENRTEPGEEAVRHIFVEAFAAVDRFNSSRESKIEVIGFGAETVCFRCDLSSYALVIRQVYLDWLGQID
jgi:hypothetical protein